MSVETIESEIREVLRRDDVKAAVHSYEIVYGRDSTDDEAVWVYVTLVENATDRDTRKKIRNLLRGTTGANETDPTWVYVRFRGEGETVEP